MTRMVSNKKDKWRGIDGINTFQALFIRLSIGIIILLISLYLIPFNVLLAYDYYSNAYLKSWPLEEGEEFTVHYIHSVELCPVSETYINREREIILTETYFESYGAGLPASTEHRFEMTESGFRIYDINEIMVNLTYRTGAEGTDPKIRIRGTDYRFLDFSHPREAVGFKIKGISFLTYIVREVL